MKIYLYEGCQTCVVRACCSNVCEKYRQRIREIRHINIMINPVSLDLCERIIGSENSPIVIGAVEGIVGIV